jgi:pyridoxine kinase
VTTALFLGNLLNGADLADALARTAASVFAVIETTVGLGRYELALVAAREELARPSRHFAARRL